MQAKGLTKWRDGEGHAQQAQGQFAGGANQVFSWVGTQCIVGRTPNQPCERHHPKSKKPQLDVTQLQQSFDNIQHGLKKLLQVHACIKLPHLRFVAIEHECFALLDKQTVFTNATFGGLAPAGVIDQWVDVGIKPILLRR
jgi:hypothetical protein